LGRSLDELPPQTRRLLAALLDYVKTQTEAQQVRRTDFHFSRKQIRAASGWGDTQLKLHLARLVELEYLLAHRIERGQGFVYELLYDGEGGAQPHLSGLIDAQNLDYDGARSGQNDDRSAPGRASVGGWSAPGRGDESAQDSHAESVSDDATDTSTKTHFHKGNNKNPSYPQAIPLAAKGAS
jgi:DNA primase